MPAKKAFVFDTNFIIQNHDLAEVVNKLKDKGFVVYVTQVAVSERIAQECIKQKGKYDKLAALQKDVADFASIKVTKSYEEIEKLYHVGMQKKYDELFGERVIPLSTDAAMFQRVLDRSYMKIPPFIQGETDKGFKDSLMWLSILDYFKLNGEDEVVFVSNDNGFKGGKEFLCDEFARETGKKIEIQDNTYYRTVTEVVQESPQKEVVKEISLPDRDALRKQIKEICDQLCYVEVENYYGDTSLEKTFKTSILFDSDYMSTVFERSGDVVKQHIFEQELPASILLNIDGRITDCECKIPMCAIDQVIGLYTDIRKMYPSYLPQFYSAVAVTLNQNFEEFVNVDDDPLPF